MDSQLSIPSIKNELRAKKVIHDYVKDNWKLSNLSSVIAVFKYNNSEEKYFSAEDRVRRFQTAVKIFYSKNCNVLLEVSTDGKNFFGPNDYSKHSIKNEDILQDVYWKRWNDLIKIETANDLKQIKTIYKNLEIAQIEDFWAYSKIHNALKFFEQAYITDWTLLKTILLFISLESIFGDKTEIAYKVAIRCSYFLYPNDKTKRREVFKFIKEGYKIRSLFIHGENVEKETTKIIRRKSEEKREHYSFDRSFQKELTDILSESLKKILLDEQLTKTLTSKESKISEYFDNFVLEK